MLTFFKISALENFYDHYNADNILHGLKYSFMFTSVLSLTLQEAAVTCKLVDQSGSSLEWIVLTLDFKTRNRNIVFYKVVLHVNMQYILLCSMHS